jgi:hypothetical protein
MDPMDRREFAALLPALPAGCALVPEHLHSEIWLVREGTVELTTNLYERFG